MTPYGLAMQTGSPQRGIDITRDFPGDTLGPVSIEDAVRRVLAYCTEPASGWSAYDLVAIHARQAGAFQQVGVWSLLLANALNGQVTLENLAAFSLEYRRGYAGRLARVPEDLDLHQMTAQQVDSVADACAFGFPGVWGPKITKVGALYRPRSIPVLDGHVAQAFGLETEAFTVGSTLDPSARRTRIARVVQALATGLAEHQDELQALRAAVTATVPEIDLISDLRLLDIVLWTSQDDRLAPRRPRQGARWDGRAASPALPLEAFAPTPVCI
jgi:hypothetical protein